MSSVVLDVLAHVAIQTLAAKGGRVMNLAALTDPRVVSLPLRPNVGTPTAAALTMRGNLFMHFPSLLFAHII